MKAIRSTVLCGLFAALLSASAMLSLPTPFGIPLTLQIFATALLAYLLPLSLTVKTILLYLTCGAVGLPVFSSMQGGISVLLGPTGGYLWGFLLLGTFCALPFQKAALRILFSLCGLLLCHLLGAVQAAWVGHSPLSVALLTFSFPLFLKDAILITAAWALSRPCKKALKHYSLLPFSKKD